jgi:hypothetical protein
MPHIEHARRRAEEERRRAEEAPSARARIAHLELAELFARRARIRPRDA